MWATWTNRTSRQRRKVTSQCPIHSPDTTDTLMATDEGRNTSSSQEHPVARNGWQRGLTGLEEASRARATQPSIRPMPSKIARNRLDRVYKFISSTSPTALHCYPTRVPGVTSFLPLRCPLLDGTSNCTLRPANWVAAVRVQGANYRGPAAKPWTLGPWSPYVNG